MQRILLGRLPTLREQSTDADRGRVTFKLLIGLPDLMVNALCECTTRAELPNVFNGSRCTSLLLLNLEVFAIAVFQPKV